MQILEVTTPNADYTGKTFGVPFINGRAVVTEAMITPQMGSRTLGDLERKFRTDYPGYITDLKGEPPVSTTIPANLKASSSETPAVVTDSAVPKKNKGGRPRKIPVEQPVTVA